MEAWRLIHSWNAAPGFNMALDEAMLLLPHGRPTLRFYTWSPETLSLGYFQKALEVPNLERAESAVRRLTGGGAIHHAHELTFSITCAAEHPLYAGEVRRSYAKLHGVILEVLAQLGVAGDFRGQNSLRSDLPSTGMCFEHSTDLDLAWDGKKGVGSAQRRTRGRVLHHGSIKLGRSSLDESVAAIWDHSPGLTPEALAEILGAGLARSLGLRLEPGEPEPEELLHASERASHFSSSAFLRRR